VGIDLSRDKGETRQMRTYPVHWAIRQKDCARSSSIERSVQARLESFFYIVFILQDRIRVIRVHRQNDSLQLVRAPLNRSCRRYGSRK
jgi:hypothetical protein